MALEIGFPNTPQSGIGHLSMAEILKVLRRFVVLNSANVLIRESILTLKKMHTLALNLPAFKITDPY